MILFKFDKYIINFKEFDCLFQKYMENLQESKEDGFFELFKPKYYRVITVRLSLSFNYPLVETHARVSKKCVSFRWELDC